MKRFNFFQKDDISEEPKEERGFSGTSISGGQLFEDDNYQWNTEPKKTIIKKMILDEKINSSLSAYKRPIERAEFSVTPFMDEDGESSEKDEENAKTVEKMLFNSSAQDSMCVPFRQVLKEALTSLEWGYCAFEKVFDRTPTGWVIKKIAYRKQDSIEKWVMDDNKPGITQQTRYPNAENKTRFNIPMDKLFVITWDKYGDNHEGISLLRSVYRMWKTKDMYWRYDNRVKEKYSGGVMQSWMPRNAGPEDKTAYETILKEFIATKRNGIVNPGPKEDGWEVEFMDLKIGDTKLLETIKELNASISEWLLTAFLDSAGSSSAGSFARTESLTDFFTNALNSWLELFVDTFNKQIMTELAFLNGWKNSPSLTFKNIEADENILDTSLAMERFVKSGIIKPDLQLENQVREKIGAGNVSEEEIAQREEDKKKEEEAIAREQEEKEAVEVVEVKEKKEDEEFHKHDDCCGHFSLDMSIPSFPDTFDMPKLRSYAREDFQTDLPRELTIFEKGANIPGLKKYVTEAEDIISKNYKAITAEMREFILKKTKESIDKNDITILENMKVPKANELKSVLTEVSKESFEIGKISTADEISQEVPKTNKDMRGVMRVKNDEQVNGFVAALSAIALAAAIQQISKKGGTENTNAGEAVDNVKKGIDQRIANGESGFKTSSVGSSINTGRTYTADQYGDKIAYAQYSAILDGRTTNRCLSLDGRVVPYGSADYYQYSAPGHFNCRSIWVFVAEGSINQEEAKGASKPIPASIPETGPLNNYQDLKNPKVLKDSLAADLIEGKE